MKRDIWPGRQLYGYATVVRLPRVKGTEDMRPSIVNVEVSPQLVIEISCGVGHDVNRTFVAY